MKFQHKIQYTLFIIKIFIFTFPIVAIAQLDNVALIGSSYIWSKNTDEFSNENKRSETELNDGNKDVFVWMNETGDVDDGDIQNAWEAAGIIWSTSYSDIKRVIFTNGYFGGSTLDDGAFTKNFHLQITKDGTVW